MGFEIAWEGERFIFSCESKKVQDEWVADFKMMTKELKLKKLEEAKKGLCVFFSLLLFSFLSFSFFFFSLSCFCFSIS